LLIVFLKSTPSLLLFRRGLLVGKRAEWFNEFLEILM
jgi:hypothetical protein